MYPIDCNHYQVFMIFFLEIRQYRGFVAQSLSHFTFKTQSDQIQSQVKKSLIRVWCFPHKSEFIYLTSIDDNLYFKRTNSSFFLCLLFLFCKSQAQLKPAECLQREENSSFQTNEIWRIHNVRPHYFSCLVTRVATDEK